MLGLVMRKERGHGQQAFIAYVIKMMLLPPYSLNVT